MKKAVILILGYLLFSSFVFSEEQLIPQRILIQWEGDAGDSLITSILFAELASKNPLIPVDNPDEAHCLMTLIQSDSSLKIQVLSPLGRGNREIRNAEMADPMILEKTFLSLAREWQEILQPIPPEVQQEQILYRDELERKISFEEQLIKPFEITLWLPLSARMIMQGDNYETKWLEPQWPLRVDMTWYPKENIGLFASLEMEYNTPMDTAYNYNIQQERLIAEAEGTIVMPGLGVQFRTIGKIAAQMDLAYYHGFVQINAKESSYVPHLSAGETSEWLFYPVLNLDASLNWAINTDWSIKVKMMDVNIGLRTFYAEWDKEFPDSSLGFNISPLQLGVSYRF